MAVQRCKGTRDLSPEEMTNFRLIERAFKDCCLKWSYEEVRTPTLEYLHLFTSAGTLTPAMLGKVYSFLDWDGWSGERVVLRPDGTIPIARYYIDNMAKKDLAKLFYVANVFIFEETGKETREKWQCGVELIGMRSPLAEVELIVLALEVLKSLGIEGVELRLSHAGLIRALLARLGLNPGEQARVFDQILDGDVDALAKLKPGKSELGRALSLLLDLKGKSSGFLKNLKAQFNHNLPELNPDLDDFIGVVGLLEALGYKYHIDMASGRGFEYYTGMIFQLFVREKKIGGGGRYDALIPLMGGRETPASGFALYLDQLMNLVKPETLAKPQKILVRVGSEKLKDGFNIVSHLHQAGYVAEVHSGGQEPADLKWTIDVKSEAPLFMLTDQVSQQKFEAKSINEVLTFLGRTSADKDSVT